MPSARSAWRRASSGDLTGIEDEERGAGARDRRELAHRGSRCEQCRDQLVHGDGLPTGGSAVRRGRVDRQALRRRLDDRGGSALNGSRMPRSWATGTPRSERRMPSPRRATPARRISSSPRSERSGDGSGKHAATSMGRSPTTSAASPWPARPARARSCSRRSDDGRRDRAAWLSGRHRRSGRRPCPRAPRPRSSRSARGDLDTRVRVLLLEDRPRARRRAPGGHRRCSCVAVEGPGDGMPRSRLRSRGRDVGDGRKPTLGGAPPASGGGGADRGRPAAGGRDPARPGARLLSDGRRDVLPRAGRGPPREDGMTTIEQVIDAIPDWAGRTVSAERIAAGLTNANYRVTVDGVPCFVRIPGPSTELLSVDRGNEAANTAAAADAGVGPAVLHHLPEWGVLVLAWLPGRTMSNEAFAEDGMPSRVAEVLRRLHAGPRFRDDFDMFRTTEAYLRVVDERVDPDPGRLSRGAARGPGDRAGPGCPSPADRPVPQRPPGRQLPRRRRAAVDRRLRVQRQRRPGLRARQHLPGAGLGRRPDGPAGGGVLRRGRRRRCSPGCGSRRS